MALLISAALLTGLGTSWLSADLDWPLLQASPIPQHTSLGMPHGELKVQETASSEPILSLCLPPIWLTPHGSKQVTGPRPESETGLVTLPTVSRLHKPGESLHLGVRLCLLPGMSLKFSEQIRQYFSPI